jgi:hypothetical protein
MRKVKISKKKHPQLIKDVIAAISAEEFIWHYVMRYADKVIEAGIPDLPIQKNPAGIFLGK